MSSGASKSSGVGLVQSVQWPSLVISWVNLFEEEPFSSTISSLRHSKFIEETIKTIFKCTTLEDISFKNYNDLAVKFIKEFYPEIIKERHFTLKNEDDILILTSLLLYTTCMKFKIEEYVAKTCAITLDDDHQESMKKFFEFMNQIEDGHFTRKTIMKIIHRCFEPEVAGTSEARKSLSPSAQRNCLRDLLGSPGKQEKYKKAKDESDVKHLNKLLQEENTELLTEKEMLTEKNKDLEVTIKKLQTQLNDKVQEVTSLKEELMQNSFGETRNSQINQIEKSLNKEIGELKKQLEDMHKDNEDLLRENEKYVEEARGLGAMLQDREEELIEKIKVITDLEEKLEAFGVRNISLENSIKELNQKIEQYEEIIRPKEELNMSTPRVEENLGEVLYGIELREKQEEVLKLQNQLKTLELVCKEKDGEIEQLEISKKDLESKIQSKCLELEDLHHTSSTLHQEVDNLLANNNTLKEELSLASCKTEELERHLYESNERFNNEIAERNAQQSQLQEVINNLEREKQDVIQKLQEHGNKIEQLEKTKTELESNLQTELLKLYDLNLISSDLQERVDNLLTENSSLDKELAKAKEDLAQATCNLEQQVCELSAKNSTLQEELDRLQNAENQLLEMNKQLSCEIKKKDEELVELQGAIQTCENEMKESQILVQNQNDKIEQLEVIKKDLESKSHNLQEQVDNLSTENSTLEKELAKAKENLFQVSSDLQQQVCDLSAKNSTLKEELDRFQNVENQLSQLIKQLNCEIDEKDTELAKLQGVIQTLENEKNDSLTLLENQGNKIEQLEKTKTELESNLQTELLKLHDLNLFSSDLQERVDNLLTENSSLDKELAKAKEDLAQATCNLEQQVCELSAKNSTLQEELDRLQNAENQLSEMNKQLSCEIKKKDEELVELQGAIQTCENEMKESQILVQNQNDKIEQLEVIKKDLESKSHNLQEQVDNLSTENSTLEKELAKAKENLFHVSSDLQQQVCDLSAKNSTLKEELDRFQNVENQLSQLIKQLNCEIDEKDTELAKLQGVIQTLENEKNDSLTLLENQGNKIEQLEKTKTELESNLQTELLKLHDLNLVSSDLQERVDNLLTENSSLDKELAKAKEDLAQATCNLEQQVCELSAKNSTLQEELDRLQNAENQLSEMNKQLSCEIKKKDEELVELQGAIQTCENEMKESQILVQNQNDKIEQLEVIKKDLESKSHNLQEQVDNLSTENSTLEKELAKAKENLFHVSSDLQQQVCDLSAKNSTLKEELDRFQNVENQLSQLIKQLNCEIDEKDTELAKLQGVIQTLENEKNDSLTLLENQGNKIEQLEKTKTELESNLQTELLKLHDLNLVSSDLQERVDNLLTENSSLDKELAKAKEDLAQATCNLEQQVCELSAKNSTLQEELDRLQNAENQLSEMNKQLSCEIKKKDEELVELQGAIQTCENEMKESQILVQNQNDKIEQLEVIKKDLESKSHNLQEQVDNLSTENSTLEKELAKAKENLFHVSSDLQQQVCDLSAKNSTLKEELDRFQNVENQLSQLIKQLNCEIDEKDTELAKLQGVIQTLENEKNDSLTLLENQVTSLRTNINSLEAKIEYKEAECVTLKKEVDQVNGVLMSLQSEYNVVNEQNKELISQLSSVTTGAAHLENIIQEDNFKIDLQERNIKKLEKTILERDGAVEKLKKEISSLKLACEEANRIKSVNETDVDNLQIQLKAKSCELDRLKEDIEALKSDNKLLADSMKRFEDENKRNETTLEKLNIDKCRLENDLKENVDKIKSAEQELLTEKETVALLRTELSTLREKLDEANQNREKIMIEKSSLQQQLENYDPLLKEAHDKLFDDYHRLNSENDELKAQLANNRSTVKAEYEEILKKMKAHMKTACTRALEVKDEKHAKELKDLQEMVKANQGHISQLSTNLWDTSDKLLIIKNENEELKKTVTDLKRKLSLHQSVPEGLHRTRSHDQLGLQSQRGLQMVQEETVMMSRRQSLRTVPSGIGKVFPSEDEAGEMFNNECLADLKAGRCQVTADPDRMSTLMYRNSLCPPHLKSSYPAETQFLPADILQEDDIKGRGLHDDMKNLPDKRKKDRSQTSYKKPGPPTPSKNGGRHPQAVELKNVASTPRTALREVNDENRKPATPSRLFSGIFSGKQRRDENVTPDRRRLSFFGRHFKKEPME